MKLFTLSTITMITLLFSSLSFAQPVVDKEALNTYTLAKVEAVSNGRNVDLGDIGINDPNFYVHVDRNDRIQKLTMGSFSFTASKIKSRKGATESRLGVEILNISSGRKSIAKGGVISLRYLAKHGFFGSDRKTTKAILKLVNGRYKFVKNGKIVRVVKLDLLKGMILPYKGLKSFSFEVEK